MIHPNRPFIRSIGMMIGAIIGVGVFGLPYAFAQSGFSIGLFQLLFIGGMLVTLQLMLGEIVVQTKGQHRLVGYIDIYLGRFWKWVTTLALGFGIWGAMLAYMVVGGTFLSLLLSPLFGGSPTLYAYLIAGVASGFIYRGLGFASKIEYIIVSILLFLFVFIILSSLPHIQIEHYAAFDISQAFVPYGVILFALAGMGIVPELKDVLGKRNEKKLASVIIIAMAIIISLYALFSFAVVGVTGLSTTEAAFDGLVPLLGPSFGTVALLLASLTILSIYMVLGIQLLNTFKFDFDLNHMLSWIVVCVIPVIFFSLGLRDFIDIIGFVGTIFGGVLGIMIAVSYWVLRRRGVCSSHQCINFPAPLTSLIVLIFTLGIVWEIYKLFV